MASFAIIPVIALFGYITLLFSALAAKKNGVVYSFIEMLFVMLIWTGGSLFMRLGYWPSPGYWFHISLTGLLLFPIAFFLFLRKFMEVGETYRIQFWMLVIIILMCVNYRYEFFVKTPDVVNKGMGGNAYVYHFTWPVIFLLAAEAGALWQSVKLFYCNRKNNMLIMGQLYPVLIGMGIMTLGQLCLFIPAFRSFPVDMCAGIIMAVCFFYALYKKRMLQLELLLSKANCYTVALLLCMFIFYKLIPRVENYLRAAFRLSITHIAIGASLIAVTLTILIYLILKFVFESLFEREGVRHSRCIRKYGEKVINLMSIKGILSELINVIEEAVDAEKTYIFLEKQEGGFKMYMSNAEEKSEKLVINDQDKILCLLEEAGGCIMLKDYKNGSFLGVLETSDFHTMVKNKIECIVGIRDESHYLGYILLSSKKSGQKYCVDDLNFFTSLNSVTSIAIKNSRLYDAAYKEARSDYLTGVANRKCFHEVLENCCMDRRYDYGSILMIDVDDFKLYNQLYGEEAGDNALIRMAELIRNMAPKESMVARYSGKVFALMLPGVSLEHAKQLAEEISEKIHDMNESTGRNAMKSLTVSCGIALGVCPVLDYHELISNAEAAVYYAKKAGKNCVMIYREGDGPKSEMDYQSGVYSDYAATIYALTAAIDAKDHYTFNHSENVAYYARELAKAYGMNEEAANIAYEAGLLHDIGKIGIDESILNKPGKLTEKEYQIMKNHVELSIGIIRYLPSLDYVIPAVMGHHERFDGEGYPRRIGGEDIPVIARILCIADSFDAMVSERTYKPRMDIDRALGILEEEAGKQFDPVLVPIFVRMVRDRVIEIR